MTKKDYIRIAKALEDCPPVALKEIIVRKLCLVFREDNPRFNKDKFINACYGKGGYQ